MWIGIARWREWQAKRHFLFSNIEKVAGKGKDVVGLGLLPQTQRVAASLGANTSNFSSAVTFGRIGAGAFGSTTTLGIMACLLYTSPSPRDATLSRMPSSA